ncbi:MAG: hypothetical protein J4F98_11705 [Acidobacteria bacterium]|nr:hypothetical protein [Acidobacteriota bacterium]
MTTHDTTSTPADPSGLEGIRENLEAAGALLREAAARAAETEARALENEARAVEDHRRAMREMAEHREETDRQMKETDRRLKKAEDLFATQWGRLMESLVRGDLVALLNERGIEVERTLQRVESRRGGRHFEVDLLAVNGREVVVVDVKTPLRSEGVTKFLSKLSEFLDWCAEYRGRRILGAVAYLDGAESVTKYAERSGLFVIRATGNSASILNEPGFKPRAFS